MGICVILLKKKYKELLKQTEETKDLLEKVDLLEYKLAKADDIRRNKVRENIVLTNEIALLRSKLENYGS